MSHRRTSRSFPQAPPDWDQSSRATWNQLIQVLEASDLFDQGRRTRPQFYVKTTISAPTTLDLSTPEVTALAHTVAKLLVALERSGFIDVRTTVA